MKSIPFFALGLTAAFSFSSCSNDETATTTTTDTAAVATTTTMESTPTTTTTTTRTLVENETYTDLRSGKTFHVRRDASGNWAADNDVKLDYYYSSAGDTFYGPSARWVNGALIHEGDNYRVDETRWNELNSGTMMEADKVKMNDEELKIKSADGDTKLKVTDDKTKLKTPDMKVKEDEDGIKVKER